MSLVFHLVLLIEDSFVSFRIGVFVLRLFFFARVASYFPSLSFVFPYFCVVDSLLKNTVRFRQRGVEISKYRSPR